MRSKVTKTGLSMVDHDQEGVKILLVSVCQDNLLGGILHNFSIQEKYLRRSFHAHGKIKKVSHLVCE